MDSSPSSNNAGSNAGSNNEQPFVMPFRPASPPEPLSETTWSLGMRIYCSAWDEYRQAGMPFGSSDEAMIVWYTFQPGADYDLTTVHCN